MDEDRVRGEYWTARERRFNIGIRLETSKHYSVHWAKKKKSFLKVHVVSSIRDKRGSQEKKYIAIEIQLQFLAEK